MSAPANEPFLRVVRGHPGPVETAALTVVLAALLGSVDPSGAPPSGTSTPGWDRPDHHIGFRNPRAWGAR